MGSERMLLKDTSRAGRQATPKLALQIAYADSAVILHCKGEIRFRRDAQLFAAKAKEILDRGSDLIIDLNGIETLDSVGLGELVLVQMRARAVGCEVCLTGVNDFIAATLFTTNVSSLFKMHATISEALVSFAGGTTD